MQVRHFWTEQKSNPMHINSLVRCIYTIMVYVLVMQDNRDDCCSGALLVSDDLFRPVASSPRHEDSVKESRARPIELLCFHSVYSCIYKYTQI